MKLSFGDFCGETYPSGERLLCGKTMPVHNTTRSCSLRRAVGPERTVVGAGARAGFVRAAGPAGPAGRAGPGAVELAGAELAARVELVGGTDGDAEEHEVAA